MSTSESPRGPFPWTRRPVAPVTKYQAAGPNRFERPEHPSFKGVRKSGPIKKKVGHVCSGTVKTSALADTLRSSFSREERRPGHRAPLKLWPTAERKADLTLHLHNVRANVIRFKVYRTEPVIPHQSFLLTNIFNTWLC